MNRAENTLEDIQDRITYAGFPDELRAAMRAAARRNGWDRATWRQQTGILHEALEADHRHPQTIARLAAAYANPPPGATAA
jgi:hypothetical protein